MPGPEPKSARPHKAARASERLDPRYAQLAALHGPAEGARRYLEELRWPDGVVCPRCSSAELNWLDSRSKYHCRRCKYQFRVTAGTVLHDSHVSMARWLDAVAAIVGSDDGFPASRLKEVLGGGYKTAWFVGHRIRSAMTQTAHGAAHPVALAADAAVEGRTAEGLTVQPDPGREAAAKWSYARAQIAGAYHRPSMKHLAAYWNEAQWRASHDGSPQAFRDTVRALLAASPLPYGELVEKAGPPHR